MTDLNKIAAEVLCKPECACKDNKHYWQVENIWFVSRVAWDGDTILDSEQVDYHNNTNQLFALAFYFLFPDKELTLTGDGHFDVREQLINFVDKCLEEA